MKDISPWSYDSTMGSLVMHMCLVAALGASLCSAVPVSDSLVVLVRSPVTVHHGHKITLPCWLNPLQSAEAMEVRWYRHNHFDSPIMFYRERQFVDTSQEASYVGRVSFGLKDPASGGLTAGDVSLVLKNVTLEDAGDYTCYASSDKGYDSASVSLIVAQTGTTPLLSVVWKEDNMANVTCESEGWYPEPSLRWPKQKQVLTPENLKHSKQSSGLLSVHSWILVSSSSEVSCSVGLSGEEAKEARVRLENSPQPDKQKSGSWLGGWVAFALAILALAVLGVLYFKQRERKAKPGTHDAEEQHKLLEEVIQPTDLSTASKYYVNVTLDKMENQHLTVKDGKLRDSCCNNGLKSTCLTAIKGTPGFTSGQHYWEVSMGNTNVGLKQSWWVGVTSAAAIPSDFTPTTSNGYWFLSSSPDTAGGFQFSTEPKVVLPIYSRPQTVGVYLDYGRGELSFYDVEAKRLIGSLTASFAAEVFPFFNPCQGDKSPMEILQRTEQGQSSETGNSVDALAMTES